MDYTSSDANVTHVGTGHRMHQSSAPITTEVSAEDMNMVIWELMSVVMQAGGTPAAFNPDVPSTYQSLLAALNAREVGVNILRYIAPGNWAAAIAGTYDSSAEIQACIDANKGRTILVPDGKFMHAGILMSGSSYDGTTIICRGELLLKQRPSSVTNNFGGAWCGLVVQGVDGVTLHYRGHGNRLVHPDEEHVLNVVVAGATNMKIPTFFVREVRGDGMYVTQFDPLANSAATKNLQIGNFSAYNTADDGRNALSLVAYDGVSIGTFESNKIGAVVGGVRQPGGLDIEPNAIYQTCTNLTIGSATVKSTGTTCFGVQGKDAGSEAYVVTGLTVGALDSTNTLGASATDGTWALNLFQVNDVSIRGRISHTLNTNGIAVRIDSAIGVVADINIGPCSKGMIVGENGWVRKSDIRLWVRNYSGASGGVGLRTCGVSDSTFRGHISGAGASSFAVQTRSNSRTLTQTNVGYHIDTPKDAATSRGYRNETTDAVAFSGCEISDCRVTGFSTWGTALDGFGVVGVRKRNIIGITDVIAMPTDGGWTQGDVVQKSNPTKDANNMSVSGWLRLTTGTANVSGTDWAIANVSHVSPAT